MESKIDGKQDPMTASTSFVNADSILAGNDKSQSRSNASKKPMLGGSLFSAANSSTVPVELAPLVPLQQSLSKATLAASSTTTKTNSDYAAQRKRVHPTYTSRPGSTPKRTSQDPRKRRRSRGRKLEDKESTDRRPGEAPRKSTHGSWQRREAASRSYNEARNHDSAKTSS